MSESEETLIYVDLGPEPSMLTDDELLTSIQENREKAAIYRDKQQRAEAELTRRLQARQATVYSSNRWDVKLVPQVDYCYDTARLGDLVKDHHVSPEEWGKVIDWTPKVSKTELNKLIKRGGEIKAIIDAAVTVHEKAPRLDIKARDGE